MQMIELAILDWIQVHLRCAFLDKALPFISSLANHGEIWIILALALLLFQRENQSRKTGFAVSIALILDLLVCNLCLKPLIGRVRPFAVNSAAELLIAPPLDASFPSGHTAVSFAAVFALKEMGSPLWKPALALAVVIAFSRLYLYVHWPTDILGGAVVGVCVGWMGAQLVQKIYGKAAKP